jgi:hypothetical protein
MDMQRRYASVDEPHPLTDTRCALARRLWRGTGLGLGSHRHSVPQICLNDQKKITDSVKLRRSMRNIAGVKQE